MRRISFSVLLAGTFVAYALYIRQGTGIDTGAPIAQTPPAQVSDTPTPIPAVQIPPSATQTPVVQTPLPTPVVQPPPKVAGLYRDGAYTGDVVDAYYGNVQVKAVITGGKITDVVFLDHPQDRDRSIMINNYAMSNLKSEAIKAQSSNVDVVSGATATSQAFIQSLASALVLAKN